MKDEKKVSEVEELKFRIEDFNKQIESATRTLELSKGVLRLTNREVGVNTFISNKTFSI
jgi:hypothetical protein